MDNPLTPKKIQRLMYFASKDKSFNGPGGPKSSIFDNKLVTDTYTLSTPQSVPDKSHQESSGLLDLEKCSDMEYMNTSLSRSTSFHPAELTGRSTEASETPKSIPAMSFSEYGRFSMNLDCLEKEMNKQTNAIQEIMRQSIASGYSFHSQRDLTADEASLVEREAPLPVNNSQINLKESMLTEALPDMSSGVDDMSMGSYFQHRCVNFSKVLGRSDSPSYDVSVGAGGIGVKCSIYNIQGTFPPCGIAVGRPDSHGLHFDSIWIGRFEPMPQQSSDQQKRETRTLNTDLDRVPVRQPKPSSTEHTFLKPRPVSPAKENRPAIPPKPKDKANVGMKMATHLLNHPGNQHLQRSLNATELGSEVGDESLEFSKLLCALDKLGPDKSFTIPVIMEMMKNLHTPNSPNSPYSPNSPPLAELDMNASPPARLHTHVTQLKDTKNSETASSANTINTVINNPVHTNQLSEPNVPVVVVTNSTILHSPDQVESRPENRTRSKSPSTKSRTTMSTVQENLLASSFKSSRSPLLSSKGEAKTSHVPSPNMQYKELDKSVDWQEILQPRSRLKSEGMVQDVWADIQSAPVNGFVGVSTQATIAIRCLVDNWLTFRVEFHQNQPNLTIDLPRFPILLAPGRTELCTIHVTSNTDTNMTLPFTVHLKDASINAEIEQDGELQLDFKMPEVQAISSDRVNRVVFPPIIEGKSVQRSFVLFSDCSEDLQLDLSVVAGSSMFVINSVQEIKKCDVSKKLIDDVGSEERKPKAKGLTKQLCRLSDGNAIKVSLTFTAPKLADINADKLASLSGALSVHLIGVNALLKSVELAATVGTLALRLPANKIFVGRVLTTVAVTNSGTIPGSWLVRLKDGDTGGPFNMSPSKLEIEAGASEHLKLTYSGPDDVSANDFIILEELHGGAKKLLEIAGGLYAPKVFPVKTNCKEMSWVRKGRKEISVKNFTDKKVHIKCRIHGEGFYLDAMRNAGVNTTMLLTFGPHEQRTLVINFVPGSSSAPLTATLHLAYEKETNISRKVFLYGCCGGSPLRWAGVVTHGETALVPAVLRRPIDLKLINTTSSPAFVAATVHFNLQYMSLAATSHLEGSRRIVPGRGSAHLVLHLDWALVERKARDAVKGTALATVTVLSGGEITRRRILKVLREEASGELEGHLQLLSGPYEGEDPTLDHQLLNFNETKASLDELVSGIQEQIAQVELSDFHNQTTIVIADETVLEHHTLLTD